MESVPRIRCLVIGGSILDPARGLGSEGKDG